MRLGRRFTAIAICLATVGLGLAVNAKAESWSAGARESYVTVQSFDFGSDRMARVKRVVLDQGFSSVTAHLRLSMKSATDSYVINPPIRSNRVSIETLVTRINHTQSEIILKPIIMQNPGMGVGNRLTGINPSNINLWFTTYGHALKTYSVIAATKEVGEFVVGVGLHHLWKPVYADRWIALLKEMRRQVGAKVKLSFELSSDEDIQAFEQWKENDSKSYDEVVELLDRVRMSVSPIERTPGEGDWSAEDTSIRITTLVERAQFLFPKKGITLANVTIPGCRDHAYDEDEVTCVADPEVEEAPENSPLKLRKNDAAYQIKGLNAWFTAMAALHPTVRKLIREVEFLEATTEFDPAIGKEDPRYLLFNAQSAELFLQKKKNSTSSPAVTRGPASARADAFSRVVITTPPQKPSDQSNKKTACIYFDDNGKPNDFLGPVQSRMLQTLIGGFKNWRGAVASMAKYTQGDLDQCDAAFYISSTFDFELSHSFLFDAANFVKTRQLIWMNYKFPAFQEFYDGLAKQNQWNRMGFSIPQVIQPDTKPTKKNLDPGFFRYFDYKGETFEKLAKWDPVGNWFSSSPEINAIKIEDEANVKVHAWARHSKTGNKIPYVVSQKLGSKGGVWYFADLPFAYVHYEDRYFIFCDLLWDILKEKPPTGPRNALVRIEDVSPNTNPEWLRFAIDYLADNNVPFSLAVIPYFSSVMGSGLEDNKPVWKPADKYAEFMGMMRYAKARGANFVWHGVAHQAGDLISGFDGTTAADYEFWWYPENRPLPRDSSEYVMNLLEKGEEVFKRMGIKPMAWEVPHYAASALDFMIFGRLFEWNYHRPIYFKEELLADSTLDDQHRMFECVTPVCRAERRVLARQIKVDVNYGSFGGQIVPYPIYEDSYGEALIPETLGMIDYAFFHDNSPYPVSRPSDLVRRAKKLKVVRGAFASFFWHSDLLGQDGLYYRDHPGNYETEGGKNTLIKTVEGIKALGYEFRSIGDCSLFPRADCRKK